MNFLTQVTNINLFTEQINTFVNDQNFKIESEVPLIIFKHVVENISIVTRALQKDTGHLLLIGSTGIGRRTLLKLAARIVKFSIFEVPTHSRAKYLHYEISVLLYCATFLTFRLIFIRNMEK